MRVLEAAAVAGWNCFRGKTRGGRTRLPRSQSSPIARIPPRTRVTLTTWKRSRSPRTTAKKQRKIKEMILGVLQRNEEALIDLIMRNSEEKKEDENNNNGCCYRYLSVEIVGTKFNRTPGVNGDVAIAPHCQQRILLAVEGESENEKAVQLQLPRNFRQAKDFLVSPPPSSKSRGFAEGIVIERGGRYWKLVSKLLDPDCDFAKDRENAMPPAVLYE